MHCTGKSASRETKKENKIQIDYKRIKIVNHYFSCKHYLLFLLLIKINIY